MDFGDLLKKKKREDLSPLLSRRPVPAQSSAGNRSSDLFRPSQSAATFSKTPTLSVLTEKISRLSQQGKAEPEIVKELKTEGYSSLDIDRSLRNSLKAGVGEPQLPIREKSVSELRRPDTRVDDDFLERTGFKMPDPLPPRLKPVQPEAGDRPRPSPLSQTSDANRSSDKFRSPHPYPQSQPQAPLQRMQSAQQPRPFPTIGFGRPGAGKDVQELIEVTVEEKWKEAEEKLKSFESRFAELDSRFKKIEDELDQMKKEEYKKEAELSTKVESYSDSLTELSTKLEGMESALKGALESVLESNRNLAESVRGIKKKDE